MKAEVDGDDHHLRFTRTPRDSVSNLPHLLLTPRGGGGTACPGRLLLPLALLLAIVGVAELSVVLLPLRLEVLPRLPGRRLGLGRRLSLSRCCRTATHTHSKMLSYQSTNPYLYIPVLIPVLLKNTISTRLIRNK